MRKESILADNPFPYITRPSTQGLTITTMPEYRGTKTQAQVYAEVMPPASRGWR